MGKRDKLKRLTTSWAGRTWSTGRMAASLGSTALRSALGGEEGGLELGQALVERMDSMKGLVMKVGQMVSYLDGSLPPEAQRVLRRLQRDAEPLHWDAVRAVIEAAFGEGPESVFDQLEQTPAAAASIGQVHRGRLGDREVAVKVQYPEIARTLEVDLGNLDKLGILAALGSSMNARALVGELRDRMQEECNYLQEAAYQEHFRALWAHDERLVIPQIFPAHTRQTVLTSEWIDGISLYEFLEGAADADRTQVGELIFEVAFGSIFGHACFNGDPHPGNYLFLDDGRVCFLDYGCVRFFDESLIGHWRNIATSILEGRKAGLFEAMEQAGFIDTRLRFDREAHWELMLYLYKPFLTPGFRYTHAYVKQSYKVFFGDNPNLRHTRFPAEWLLTNRLQWGLNSVLAILEATGRWGDLYREVLARPTRFGSPPPPLQV